MKVLNVVLTLLMCNISLYVRLHACIMVHMYVGAVREQL